MCAAGFLLLLVTLPLADRFRLYGLYGISVFFCFFSIGVGLAGERLRRTDFPFSDGETMYQVVIQDNPEMKERSVLCRVRLEGQVVEGMLQKNEHANLFLLYFPQDSAADTLHRGDRLWVYARMAPPANNGNPDEFDYVRFLIRRGGSGTAYVPAGHWRVVGHNASRTLRQAASDYREEVVALYHRLGFRGDNLAVLSALTVGDKENLSEDIRETYSVTGASHVLALSGLHIGLISTLFLFLFTLLWRRWAVFRPLGYFLVILFLWAFAFFTGLSSSVVRSVIMFSLLAVARLHFAKQLSLNTLAATAFLMLLYNPLWLFDVGFQLSFVAVTSILLIQPRLYSLLPVKHVVSRYVWGLLTVSVAAQAGTAPLVMFYFSRFSTHFLLTNLWVIPVVTLVLYAAVLMLVLTPFPVLQGGVARVVDALLDAQNSVLGWIEGLPVSSIDGIWVDGWEIGLFYLFLLLLLWCLHVRTVRSVYISLCCLLLLSAYHVVSDTLSLPRRSIAFYKVRSCPAVHCIAANGDSWLACADSVPDTSRLYRALSSHWNRQHLSAPSVLPAVYSSPGLAFHDGILFYAGKYICLLHDSRWRYKVTRHPLQLDYLYISRGYNGGIEELTSLFRIRTVILDVSLSGYRVEKLSDDCRRLSIPCISLKERGALRIPL